MSTIAITLTPSSSSPWAVPLDFNVFNNTIQCTGADGGSLVTATNVGFTPGSNVNFAVGASGSNNPAWIGGTNLATSAVRSAGGGGAGADGSITITYTPTIKVFEQGMGGSFQATRVAAY